MNDVKPFVKEAVRDILKGMKNPSPQTVEKVVREVLIQFQHRSQIEEIKAEIVSVGRHLYGKGFLDGTSGNISVRLPDNSILITSSGVCKGFLEKEDIVRISLEGTPLQGERKKPSSETKMHLFSYKMRPDVKAIVHAHPPFSTGFAAANIPLDMPVLPEAILVLGEVPLVKYGTPSTEEVPQSLKPHIEKCNAFLLANHGALTFGKTLKEASHRMETLELFAKVILIARLLGGEKRLSYQELTRLKEVFGI